MIEIPWELFSEEALHVIISEFYEHLGFRVYNLHRIQRPMEKGADLVLAKEGKEVVAIAVKIKPRKNDAYQLIELSRRREENKLYIFIGDPSPDFKEEMGRCKKEVRFINENDLTADFFERDPYFAVSLYCDNTPFALTSARIRDLFLTCFDEQQRTVNGPNLLNNTSLKTLWRLKDNSSVLYKLNNFVAHTLRALDKSKFNKEATDALLEGYSYLLMLMGTVAQEFEKFFKEFLDENINFMKDLIRKTRIGSNWLHLSSFRVFSSAEVENLVVAIKEEEIKIKGIIENSPAILVDKVTEYALEERESTLEILNSIENACDKFNKFWWGVEETIDDCFNYALDNALQR